MPKFFVTSKQLKEKDVIIQGEDVNHIKNVLRKKAGDLLNISITDIKKDCVVEIETLTEQKVICKIKEYTDANTEPSIKVTIFQGLPKSDKMELIIQKAVELGGYDIYPVNMERCIVKLKDKEKKLSRWQKISEVASKQSGRGIIPEIKSCIEIKDICNFISQYDKIIVAYEEEKQNTLKLELKKINSDIKKIGIVIGPEGGIDKKEIEILKRSGANIVTLGNRILRTETVALNILSCIMYEFEQ